MHKTVVHSPTTCFAMICQDCALEYHCGQSVYSQEMGKVSQEREWVQLSSVLIKIKANIQESQVQCRLAPGWYSSAVYPWKAETILTAIHKNSVGKKFSQTSITFVLSFPRNSKRNEAPLLIIIIIKEQKKSVCIYPPTHSNTAPLSLIPPSNTEHFF